MSEKITGTSITVYILCLYLGLLYCMPVAYGTSAHFNISIEESAQQQPQEPPAQQSDEQRTRRSGGGGTGSGYTPPSNPSRTSTPPSQTNTPPAQRTSFPPRQSTTPPARPPESGPPGEQRRPPASRDRGGAPPTGDETQEYDEPLDAILVVADTEEALDNKINEFGVNADLPLIIAVSITLVSVGLGISGAGNLTGMSHLHLPF